MSLLHRALLSAAFKEMLQKFEPIVQDTLETAVAVVAPAAAPVIDAGIELAAAASGLSPAGATTSDHVAAAVAAAGAPSAGAVSPTPPAAPAAPNAAAAVAPAATAAALAACDAISQTLAQLATQIAAIRSNVA